METEDKTSVTSKMTIVWDVTPSRNWPTFLRCLSPDGGSSKHISQSANLSVSFCETNIPEDSNLHIHRRENLKSHFLHKNNCRL